MAMRTILVLGDPENNDLDAVLNVPNNLILVVAQVVPTTPSPPRATVLVLLLNSPLAIHASGALRLASVLEQAHLIAKSWRSRPLTPAIYILTERNGEFQMQSRPSPRSSSEISSIISHSTHKVSSRPFDVVINFIPPIPDPAVLKHAILVTSLANPFLSTSLVSHLGRRPSSSSFSFRTLAAPPADADALLIHVLPTPISTRSKLVASIEHVVLSFTTPAHASPPTTRPSSPVSLHPQNTLLPRTRAYLLPKGVLADPAGPPAHAYRAPSVARVLLEGHAALTPPPSKKVDGENMAGIGAFGSARTHETRAWIGAGEDVMVPSGPLSSVENLKPRPPLSPKQSLSSKPRVLSPKSPPTVPPGLLNSREDLKPRAPLSLQRPWDPLPSKLRAMSPVSPADSLGDLKPRAPLSPQQSQAPLPRAMSLKVPPTNSLGDSKPRAPLSPQQPQAPPPRAMSLKVPPANSLRDSKPKTPLSPQQPQTPLSSTPRVSSPKIPPASPIEKPKEVILRKVPPSSELPTPPASIRMLPLRVPEGEKKKYIWEVAVEEKEQDVWREHRYHYTKATDARASVAFAVKDPRKRKVRWWKWLFVW